MKYSKKTVILKRLRDGMVLAEPIYDVEGKVLFSEGLRLNPKRIERIQQMGLKSVMIETDQETPVQETPLSIYEAVPENSTSQQQSAMRKQKILNDTRQEAGRVVKDAFEQVLDDGSVKTDKIKRIVESVIEAILYDDQVVLNLSNLSTIDDYMLSHSVNVCVLSLVMGIYLGYSQVKLVKLGTGALIHDIGKMLVPGEIMNKPGPLTDEEFDQVKQHTIYGHKILKDTLQYDAEMSNIPLSHHERMDGKGYPYGKSNHEIPIFSKIVAVADVFDALTTDRVYCKKVSYYEGVEYLLNHVNSQFDEDVVKKFVTIIGFYPMGLPVKLSTGDVGIVLRKNGKKPLIKVQVDANGNRLMNYYEIDLYKNPTITIIDVDVQKPA